MQNAQVSPFGTHANSVPSRKAFFSIVSAPARFTRRLTPLLSCGVLVFVALTMRATSPYSAVSAGSAAGTCAP